MSLIGAGGGILAGGIAGGVVVGSALGNTFGKTLIGTRYGVVGGLYSAGKQVKKLAFEGTSFTNPIFNTQAAKGYGKRGLNGNNLNTDGLSLNLYKNRRKF